MQKDADDAGRPVRTYCRSPVRNRNSEQGSSNGSSDKWSDFRDILKYSEQKFLLDSMWDIGEKLFLDYKILGLSY